VVIAATQATIARAATRFLDIRSSGEIGEGVDIIVHSAFHPVLGPDRRQRISALSYYRQSLASDLGAMANRVGAKHLMLTHLAHRSSSDTTAGSSGGPLTQADYRKAVEAGGFTGNTIVGTDLANPAASRRSKQS